MIFTVTVYHQRPCYRKGDREAETVISITENFKTKKLAEDYVERALQEKKKSGCTIKGSKREGVFYVYTGKSWIHENTGDRYEEIFRYNIAKAI